MRFYNSVVGLEESYRRPAIKAGFLGNGNTHHDIGMVEVTSPLSRTDEPGLNHLAFELENEVDLVAGYQKAVAAGIEFPRTVDHDIHPLDLWLRPGRQLDRDLRRHDQRLASGAKRGCHEADTAVESGDTIPHL